jgi:hypothetical protein
MAEWPTLGQLKSSLAVNTDSRDGALSAALAAAIEQVKIDVWGDVDGFDTELEESGTELEVTSSLSQAALLLAVMVSKAPDAPYGIAAVFDTGGLTVAAQHPTYNRLLTGHRRSFGIS